MKPSHLKRPFPRFVPLAKTALALTVLATVAACTSVSDHQRTADTPIPIQTVNSAGGEVARVRAYESSDRLHVSGSIGKSFGRPHPYAAHVDVQLVDASGRVIAEKQDDIDPGHPLSAGTRSGKQGYAASFPLSDARKAAKIVVRYHLEGHSA